MNLSWATATSTEPIAPGLQCVSFNQDYGCFAIGTAAGFRIFNTDPLQEKVRREYVPDYSGTGVGTGTSFVVGSNNVADDGGDTMQPSGLGVGVGVGVDLELDLEIAMNSSSSTGGLGIGGNNADTLVGGGVGSSSISSSRTIPAKPHLSTTPTSTPLSSSIIKTSTSPYNQRQNVPAVSPTKKLPPLSGRRESDGSAAFESDEDIRDMMAGSPSSGGEWNTSIRIPIKGSSTRAQQGKQRRENYDEDEIDDD
ncbi:hypothetical protein HDU76_006430, partial [Blyttiomyces sp. JEL0837]